MSLVTSVVVIARLRTAVVYTRQLEAERNKHQRELLTLQQYQQIQQELAEHKRAEQIQTVMFRIAQAANSLMDLTAYLQFIREQLGTLIDTTNFYTALYDDATGLYSFPYWADAYEPEEEDWGPQPLPDSLTDYVRRTQRPLLIDDTTHKQLIQAGKAGILGPYSHIWLGAPLKTAQGVIGVVVLQVYDEDITYTSDSLDLLAFAAETIGPFIEHIKVQNALKAYGEQLEARVMTRTAELTAALRQQQQAEDKLKEYAERLEEMVAERTQALENTQDQLVRQERLAAVGQLAGSVAHELRNPLSVITNSIYFLKMVITADDERLVNYLNIINKASGEATRIVSDLLDFTRVRQPQVEPFVVADWVAEVVAQTNLPNNVTVVKQIPPDLPAVWADAHQMKQVLLNLVTNAGQAMPDGGRLTIKVTPKQEWIEVVVQDTGVGMSAKVMSQIFEPLFSTKVHGIGLGLPTVKNLVTMNNGRIQVQSIIGQGSVFTLTLPIVSQTSPKQDSD